ncbi:MAG TPA: GNAT family N-acetyltransferase, partial [Acidimicrobiia bacterium]
GTASIVVRPSQAGDFDNWLALFEAVAGEALWLGAEAPLDPATRRDFFDRCLKHDDAIFLAESGGGLVGAVSVSLSGGLADLGMFVARDRRGAGVGSALVEAAIGWAREAGAYKVSLAVWAHNHAARALYAKFGFVTEGVRRRHYRRRNGQLWDAVLMGLILDESTPGGPGADRPRRGSPLSLPPGGLTAGGLVLRPWQGADAPALIVAVDDPEIHRWLDTIPHPYTSADAEEFLFTTRRDLTEGRGVGVAVTGEGGLLGAIGLRLPAENPGVGEVGYWVAAAARGRGVATTAARALSDWALDDLGLRRVELYAAVDNAASRAVAERAGFEWEGIRRAWRAIHGGPTDFAAYARVAATT